MTGEITGWSDAEIKELLVLEMSNYSEEYAEIDGRIYLQTRLLLPQGDYQESNSVLLFLAIDVQHKLRALLYHKENFINVENTVINQCMAKEENVRIPSNLYFEFEAFLFQVKSVLDITIKILKDLFPDRFKTNTFGDKGSKLIANLNKHKDYIEKDVRKKFFDEKYINLYIKYRGETIDSLISMLGNDKIKWLDKVISMRDTISHYKGSGNCGEVYRYSTVVQDGEELKSVIIPKILDFYPRQLLEIAYRNCIEFIQDFICLFIELWLPPMFFLIEASDTDPLLITWRKRNLPAAKYIKYSLGIREFI